MREKEKKRGRGERGEGGGCVHRDVSGDDLRRRRRRGGGRLVCTKFDQAGVSTIFYGGRIQVLADIRRTDYGSMSTRREAASETVTSDGTLYERKGE